MPASRITHYASESQIAKTLATVEQCGKLWRHNVRTRHCPPLTEQKVGAVCGFSLRADECGQSHCGGRLLGYARTAEQRGAAERKEDGVFTSASLRWPPTSGNFSCTW